MCSLQCTRLLCTCHLTASIWLGSTGTHDIAVHSSQALNKPTFVQLRVATISSLAAAPNVCIMSFRTHYQWPAQWCAKCYQTIVAMLKTRLSQWCHGRCRQHYRPLLLAEQWCKWAWVRTHAVPQPCRQCSRKSTSLAAGCTPTRSAVSFT